MIYKVAYKDYASADIKTVFVDANSKAEAYDKAVYDAIDELPYSAWVESVRYKNGRIQRFNTFEGNPY